MFITATAVIAATLSVVAYKDGRNPPVKDRLAIAHYVSLILLLASILWSLK